MGLGRTYTVVFTGEDDNTSYTLEDLTVSNVVIHSSFTVTTPPPVVYVCEIIDGAQYTTLGEALSSVPEGQSKTIRLLADIQLGSGLDIRKKDITFDLAGHKLDVVDTSSDGVGLFCGERHWVVPAVE